MSMFLDLYRNDDIMCDFFLIKTHTFSIFPYINIAEIQDGYFVNAK